MLFSFSSTNPLVCSNDLSTCKSNKKQRAQCTREHSQENALHTIFGALSENYLETGDEYVLKQKQDLYRNMEPSWICRR